MSRRIITREGAHGTLHLTTPARWEPDGGEPVELRWESLCVGTPVEQLMRVRSGEYPSSEWMTMYLRSGDAFIWRDEAPQ